MVHGLKIAFSGKEIIHSLDARIEAKRAAIRLKRDEITGNVQPESGLVWQVPAEEVEDEIQDIEHSIRTLTLVRDRLVPGETYLLGMTGLKLAGLLPERPAPLPDLDPDNEIRWVTRAPTGPLDT